MNQHPTPVTRREALLGSIKGTIAAALVGPFVTNAAEVPSSPEPEFVPENDYPFFGHQPVAEAPITEAEK